MRTPFRSLPRRLRSVGIVSQHRTTKTTTSTLIGCISANEFVPISAYLAIYLLANALCYDTGMKLNEEDNVRRRGRDYRRIEVAIKRSYERVVEEVQIRAKRIKRMLRRLQALLEIVARELSRRKDE